MSYSLVKWISGLLLTTFLASSACAEVRIATVDMGKLFEGYWRTKQARASLEERKVDLEKERLNMVTELKKANEDYQNALAGANDQAVSSDEREKRKRNAEDKLKEAKAAEERLGSYVRTATATLEEQINRMKKNVVSEIRTVVTAKAKAGNYALVLDAAEDTPNMAPVILYNSNENDLTQAVLEQLNAAAPAEPPKPEAKPADKKDEKKK
jgi:outer membrane protein